MIKFLMLSVRQEKCKKCNLIGESDCEYVTM